MTTGDLSLVIGGRQAVFILFLLILSSLQTTTGAQRLTRDNALALVPTRGSSTIKKQPLSYQLHAQEMGANVALCSRACAVL